MALQDTIDRDQLADLLAQRNDVRLIEVDITSAEILAMNTTPKTLIPAPRPGNVIELLSAVLILDFATTAYTTNGDVTIQTAVSNTALSDTVAGADYLLGTADETRLVQALSADVDLDVNEGLELVVASGDPAAGNSPARVRVAYRIHATGL